MKNEMLCKLIQVGFNPQLHLNQSDQGGNPAAVALSSSQAERTHTLCVFTGRFNGVEMAATSGMPASAAVTSDGKGLQAVGVDEPSFFTRLADPAVKTCRSAAS